MGKGLELLCAGLVPFVEREFNSAYGECAPAETPRILGEDYLNASRPVDTWDVAALLKVMWEAWNEGFRKTLGPAERNLLSELCG